MKKILICCILFFCIMSNIVQVYAEDIKKNEDNSNLKTEISDNLDINEVQNISEEKKQDDINEEKQVIDKKED